MKHLRPFLPCASNPSSSALRLVPAQGQPGKGEEHSSRMQAAVTEAQLCRDVSTYQNGAALFHGSAPSELGETLKAADVTVFPN